MNGGYVMIDLGTFGYNNEGINKSAVDKINENLGKKPLYFTFKRVDEEEEELVYMGTYVFYGNVFKYSNNRFIVIPVVTYPSDEQTIRSISIKIDTEFNSFNLIDGYATANED